MESKKEGAEPGLLISNTPLNVGENQKESADDVLKIKQAGRFPDRKSNGKTEAELRDKNTVVANTVL